MERWLGVGGGCSFIPSLTLLARDSHLPRSLAGEDTCHSREAGLGAEGTWGRGLPCPVAVLRVGRAGGHARLRRGRLELTWEARNLPINPRNRPLSMQAISARIACGQAPP